MNITDPRVIALGKALAAMTDPLGVWEEQTSTYQDWYILPAMRLLDAADTVDPLRQPGHVVEFRESGYGLQHPPECRPNLLDCMPDVVLSEQDKAPKLPGRYKASLDADLELHLDPIDVAPQQCDAANGVHSTPHVGCILR